MTHLDNERISSMLFMDRSPEELEERITMIGRILCDDCGLHIYEHSATDEGDVACDHAANRLLTLSAMRGALVLKQALIAA